MRRRQVLVAGAGAAVLLGTGCPHAAPATTTAMPSTTPVATAAAAGVWNRAIAVPGLVALNKGRYAGVSSVSCLSPGSCAAGGDYRDDGGHQQGFVVSKVSGRWRQAIEVPGLGALNKGRNADAVSVSCASAGCAAGGYYGNHGKYDVTSGRGFVVLRRHGRWRRAVEVPGLRALNTGGNAEVSSVSCAPPGYCAAAGFYTDGSSHQQGFVAVEQNGVWGRAIEVPGLGALNKGGGAVVWSVSCASPGNCAAGGDYDLGVFVAIEKNGAWGKETTVPGALRVEAVNSVSCASAGSCVAGGSYDGRGYQGFVT